MVPSQQLVTFWFPWHNHGHYNTCTSNLEQNMGISRDGVRSYVLGSVNTIRDAYRIFRYKDLVNKNQVKRYK